MCERFIGKPYTQVQFRWSGLAQRDVCDRTSFTLKAAAQNLVSDPVGNAFLARVFSQSPSWLLPEVRSYPSTEDVVAFDGSHRSLGSVTSEVTSR